MKSHWFTKGNACILVFFSLDMCKKDSTISILVACRLEERWFLIQRYVGGNGKVLYFSNSNAWSPRS